MPATKRRATAEALSRLCVRACVRHLGTEARPLCHRASVRREWMRRSGVIVMLVFINMLLSSGDCLSDFARFWTWQHECCYHILSVLYCLYYTEYASSSLWPVSSANHNAVKQLRCVHVRVIKLGRRAIFQASRPSRPIPRQQQSNDIHRRKIEIDKSIDPSPIRPVGLLCTLSYMLLCLFMFYASQRHVGQFNHMGGDAISWRLPRSRKPRQRLFFLFSLAWIMNSMWLTVESALQLG